jgi:hypothetical protein
MTLVSVEKIQDLLKYDKNEGYFTWKRFQIYDNISLNSSYNENCFKQNWREKQNTKFLFNNIF